MQSSDDFSDGMEGNLRVRQWGKTCLRLQDDVPKN